MSNGIPDNLIEYASVEQGEEGGIIPVGYIQSTVSDKSNRSEISIDIPYNEFDTVEYDFAFRFPALGFNLDTSKRFWVVSQWHDRPPEGVEWKDYAKNSPPISFLCGIQDGQELISIEHLNGQHKAFKLMRNRWYQVKCTILWSQGKEGVVDVVVDIEGEESKGEYSFDGANMLNERPHYFKIGQYRDTSFETTDRIDMAVVGVKNLGSI